MSEKSKDGNDEMTRQEFIYSVIEEITENYSIPLTIRPERVNKLIDNTLRHFRQYDPQSSQTEYVVISKNMFSSESFQRKRVIKLPNCIEAIYELKETGGYPFGNNLNPDYRKTQFYLAATLMGNSDDMVYAVAAQYYFDFTKQFIMKTVSFEFNSNSCELVILGRNLTVDIIATAAVHLREEHIFRSDLFFRYIVAKAKISFGTTMSFFEFKLIGDVTIDPKQIKEDGEDELEKCEEELKGRNDDSGFFMLGDNMIW